MSKFLKAIIGLTLAADPAIGDTYGLGRPALPAEIAAWDLDVSPDGTGLPDGAGSAAEGEPLFEANCASCHGSFAEGVDNWPKLAGGFDTLANDDPLKTVGSYWPYLSTVWDYVHRSMPFGDAQTLKPDEVYAITAYILYSNDLVDVDFVLSKDTFLDVEMPNASGFIIDDRIAAEHSLWVGEPCMENCKGDVKVTMRALVLDVTPEEEGVVTEGEPAAEVEATGEPEPVAAVDPELIADGEKVFKKCKACHQVGDGAKNRSGPVLNGIIGRAAGTVDGFKYSKPLLAKADEGLIWNEETLAEFLTKPKAYIKGTKMSFSGLRKDEDLAAIAAYLATFAE